MCCFSARIRITHTVYICSSSQLSRSPLPPCRRLPAPPRRILGALVGGRVFLQVFKVFVSCLLVFCQVCRSTRSQTAGRPTRIPIRDPQVTTVPLPVRNIGGSVSTHRQKGKNRQATLTGSYFRSVGAPKRQPLFRECDCEPDCEVMGSRSFLAWVWTCISIQPSSVGPI